MKEVASLVVKKAKRVVILSGAPLCTNPRVVKEARALIDAGYEVTVLGAWFDDATKERDKRLIARSYIDYRAVVDWTARNPVGRANQFFSRLRLKTAQLIHSRTNHESRWQVGYATSAMVKMALASEADLFIAHSEQGLIAASQLSVRGLRVGIDLEDWFSEDLLPADRTRRPIRLLRKMEQTILRSAAISSCPSQAMSDVLATEFGCQSPIVIYNAFQWSDRIGIDGLAKDRRRTNVPSIHWYSQTLGAGRGLEELMRALPHLTHDAEIHLRGRHTAGFKSWLEANAPDAWRARIFVHEVVESHELLSRIAEHDIGFAGEQKFCRSRDFTVTNKILHYLLGGLAVVASDTAGQREIAQQSGLGVSLYRTGDETGLAKQLDDLLGNRERLAQAKADGVRAAERIFCWEQQVPKLLNGIEFALS